jgi:hypothetical protein
LQWRPPLLPSKSTAFQDERLLRSQNYFCLEVFIRDFNWIFKTLICCSVITKLNSGLTLSGTSCIPYKFGYILVWSHENL